MKKMKKPRHAVVLDSATVLETLASMNEAVIKHGGMPGLATVVNAENKVVGSVSDGDVRKALEHGVNLEGSIANVMNRDPVIVTEHEILSPGRLAKLSVKYQDHIRALIIVDDEGQYIGLTKLSDQAAGDSKIEKISVYGMGYVGLTLALTLAEQNNFDVTGYEKESRVVDSLNDRKTEIFERGLDVLLEEMLVKKKIQFRSVTKLIPADMHIVCVGTPVNSDRECDTSQVFAVLQSICTVLRKSDVIVFRSTLPVGSCRGFISDYIEANTEFRVGRDVYLAFAPERTVEGEALIELKQLPQVIGGMSSECLRQTSEVFRSFVRTIVEVDSLEVAEFTKLINNTFRDVSFAFANEVAFLCASYNLNAFDVLAAANEGYPRNPIPSPSPGVGGACLTKDPMLYEHHSVKLMHTPLMGSASRAINEKCIPLIFNRFKEYQSSKQGATATDWSIFVVGIAFKGTPETTDIRFSPAVELVDLVLNAGGSVRIYDAVAAKNNSPINLAGCDWCDSIMHGAKGMDGIFFINNHPDNYLFNHYHLVDTMKRGAYFFDGWCHFKQEEIEGRNGAVYSTLGYQTAVPKARVRIS